GTVIDAGPDLACDSAQSRPIVRECLGCGSIFLTHGASPKLYPLSLRDALPIYGGRIHRFIEGDSDGLVERHVSVGIGRPDSTEDGGGSVRGHAGGEAPAHVKVGRVAGKVSGSGADRGGVRSERRQVACRCKGSGYT